MQPQADAHRCQAGAALRFSIQKLMQKMAVARTQQALAAMFLVVVTANAYAQAGAACVPGGTVAQTNACAVEAFQKADTDNTILYGDVMRILSAHERPLLRRDQNEWIRQRAATCKKAEAAHEAQSDWPRRYHECLSTEIAKRKKELMVWLHEGPPPALLQK